MFEMKDWSERVLASVGPQGPHPQEYAGTALAFSWIRKYDKNYLQTVQRLVIDPHEAWLNADPDHLNYGMYFNLLLHIWYQPRGYAGDGDLLTKLYRSLDSAGADCPWVFNRWDSYIASRPEVLALQSRPEYLSMMASFAAEHGCTSFLDVGCGVGEFTRQVYQEQGDRITSLMGIDNDDMSISIARKGNRSTGIDFVNMNVLETLPEGTFDVVWCVGLCDYLSHNMFVKFGRRLLTLQPKFVIIGNIGQSHPTKEMMSCLKWDLFDRSRFDLLALGEEITCGNAYEVEVETDRTGLQHFLRIRL